MVDVKIPPSEIVYGETAINERVRVRVRVRVQMIVSRNSPYGDCCLVNGLSVIGSGRLRVIFCLVCFLIV